MDTHKYNLIEQEAAKDLLVIEPSSHSEITYVKRLGVSVFQIAICKSAHVQGNLWLCAEKDSVQTHGTLVQSAESLHC